MAIALGELARREARVHLGLLERIDIDVRVQMEMHLLAPTLVLAQQAKMLRQGGDPGAAPGSPVTCAPPRGRMRYAIRESKYSPGTWIVQAMDLADGDYPQRTLFSGPEARQRAEAYASEKNAALIAARPRSA